MPDDPALRIFPDEFVPNAEGTPYHGKWVRANPSEASKWAAFRDDVVARKQVVPPVMATKYGKALVAAGKEHMSISHFVGTVTPPFPAPVPPPAGGGGNSLPLQPPAWSSPITISSGGTYDGEALGVGWESTGSQNVIFINTTQPVIIQNSWIRNLTGGARLVQSVWPQAVNVTFRRCRFYGGSRRVIELEGHQSFTMQNCTFENTSGIRLNGPLPAGASTLIEKVRHHNVVDDSESSGTFGNFIQWNALNQGTHIVRWCEVVNEYNASRPEDVVSMINTTGLTIEDCLFQHQSEIGNASPTSQNTLTVEQSCTNIRLQRNQLLDAMGIAVFGGSGHNILDNRVVQDGKLPDGVTQNANCDEGIYIDASTSNTHATGNVVGFVNSAGGRADGRLDGSIEGWGSNTQLPNPIDATDEAAELTFWQQKLTANSITIGA